MVQLILIRGLPGSGKSTIAGCFMGHYHIETDRFFELDGEYKFDPAKLKEAHEWCQRETYLHLEKGDSVVVANTFSQKWEIYPYVKIAEDLGIEYSVIEVSGNHGSIHGVPQETIQRMKVRWEKWE